MSYDPMYGKTAEELRQMAADCDRREQESFQRSDTDGFLSQWASGITARLYRQQANVLDNGGWEFSALFDLEGNLLAAKEIQTMYGWAWALLQSDDSRAKFNGVFFNPSRARNKETARINNAKKGYYVGKIKTKNVIAEIMGSGTGLAGAANAYVGIRRTDGGFSREVEIIDNGIGE